MEYEIVNPPLMAEQLCSHLLSDRRHEQMAITLCGVNHSRGKTRLLGRHLIQMPPSAFVRQSGCGLALHPDAQRYVVQLAARERLSQVDYHTHPGDGPMVNFSSIDDNSERELAAYFFKRLRGTLYGSVVLNSQAMAARVWEIQNGQPVPVPIPPPEMLNANMLLPLRKSRDGHNFDADRFDRQIRAFGVEFQRRLSSIKVGIVGVGGLGSVMVEELTRLGVQDWIQVEPQRLEASNSNRFRGATARDVYHKRFKVEISARNIKQIDSQARVKNFRCSVFSLHALRALKDRDLLIATTDDDASRLVLNALSCQYLIPIVHVGVNLEPNEKGAFRDISGEFVIPSIGSWCLVCAGIIDTQRASRDMVSPEQRAVLVQRGYLKDVPAPAVYHLNSVVASMAVAEIHNLLWLYKPIRRYMVYRELEGELMGIEVSPSERCVYCGPEGRRGLGDLIPLWVPKPALSFEEMGIPPAGAEQSGEDKHVVGREI